MRRAWTACLTLLGLLAFSLGPVCGSATDVDADACCERHSQTDCAGMAPQPEQHPTPEECCQSGHLLYPVAKMEAKAQVAPGADLGSPYLVFNPAAGKLPPYTIPSLTPIEVQRPPGVPLYELTATYRL